MKEAVNLETFKQVQTKEPKIIHISCHGDFDQKTKEFYLKFEEYGTGLVDRFYKSRI